jgi:hypothetical protein
MATQRSLYTKRRHHRNGGESKNGNGHRAPVQIDGRTLRGLSNGDVHERNVIAARLVRGDAEPIKLNVAQAAALACTTIAGVYDALRQLP